MPMSTPKLLDTVVILTALSADRLILSEDMRPTPELPLGLLGTIVEVYPQEPHYLIEFSDTEGCEYAMALMRSRELLVVHHTITPALASV